MFKKGFAITSIFIVSTFVQLITQIVITRLFGAAFELDVFLAAVAVPTILVSVIYSTLNDAFLPLFGEVKQKSEKKADEYFFQHLFTLGLLSVAVSFILFIASPIISSWFYAPRGPEFITEVANMMRYMMFSVPLAVVSTMLGSYFYVKKQFIRFPLAQAIGNISNLALIFLLAPTMGVWALVVGFIAAILLQIFIVLPGKPNSFTFKTIPVQTLLWLWLPLLIGAVALRSDALLIRSFGATLPTGYLVYLNLVSKIFSLATGVLTIGIQVLLLPHLIEYIAQKKYKLANATVNKAKLAAIGISVLASLSLAAVTPFFINLLFVGGEFTTVDAAITASLIPYFIVPSIGWGLTSVFFQPLLALKKQREVGIVSVLALVLAWAAAWFTEIFINPLAAITVGLSVLLFTAIGGGELLWQLYKRKLLK